MHAHVHAHIHHTYFVHSCTLRFFLYLGCYKYYCSEHGGHISFQRYFLWINTQKWIIGSHGSYIFCFLKKYPYCFPGWPYQFAYLPKVHTLLLFSTSSSSFVISYLSAISHSTDVLKCGGGVSRCSFDLDFADDMVLSIFSCRLWF